MSGRKLVEESVLAPWEGMWLSSLLTLPLGIIFTYKATTDSVLFDVSSYIDIIKRPFRVLQIHYKDPSVVFHKDVEIPDDFKLQSDLVALENLIKLSIAEIDKKKNGFRNIYLSLFTKDQSGLRNLIDKYNELYEVIAVKYRERLFLRASLEKFPRLDFEMYEILPIRRKLNYLLMTVLFIPIGLYLFVRAYFKLQILKQKIEIVKEQLVYFKGAPDHI
jgi:hypothetical protein